MCACVSAWIEVISCSIEHSHGNIMRYCNTEYHSIATHYYYAEQVLKATKNYA